MASSAHFVTSSSPSPPSGSGAYSQYVAASSSSSSAAAPSGGTGSNFLSSIVALSTLIENQKQLWPHLDFEESPLPTSWSPKDKFTLLDLSRNNLRVHYKGQGKNDMDAAAVRANHAISPACGVYYYEVKIIDKGRDGFIGIGFCGPSVGLNRLPGWDKLSWGYHGDDGHTFCSSSQGATYGPPFTTGDVIGCCINFVENTCFYTKNGVNLGIAFRNMKGKFYPCVGLRTPNEVVEANFGQEPFEFDIEGYLEEMKSKLVSIVESQPIVDEKHVSMSHQAAMSALITSYLVHHGYSETARIFAQETNSVISEDAHSMEQRRIIREHTLSGNIDQAIEETQKSFPGVFQAHPALLFRLKCRKFVEKVRDGACGPTSSSDSIEQLMIFGQELQYTADTTSVGEDNQRALADSFSLLAYPNPLDSPVAHLLDPSQREPIALALNSAILEAKNLPKNPALEMVVKQSHLVLEEMQKQSIGAAAFLSLKDYMP